jgi:octaprenyl-diphosphate synthase
LINAITAGDRTAFTAVCRIIRQEGGLDYTLQRAEKAVEDAMRALNCLPPSTFKEGLEVLARLAVQRTS